MTVLVEIGQADIHTYGHSHKVFLSIISQCNITKIIFCNVFSARQQTQVHSNYAEHTMFPAFSNFNAWVTEESPKLLKIKVEIVQDICVTT